MSRTNTLERQAVADAAPSGGSASGVNDFYGAAVTIPSLTWRDTLSVSSSHSISGNNSSITMNANMVSADPGSGAGWIGEIKDSSGSSISADRVDFDIVMKLVSLTSFLDGSTDAEPFVVIMDGSDPATANCLGVSLGYVSSGAIRANLIRASSGSWVKSGITGTEVPADSKNQIRSRGIHKTVNGQFRDVMIDWSDTSGAQVQYREFDPSQNFDPSSGVWIFWGCYRPLGSTSPNDVTSVTVESSPGFKLDIINDLTDLTLSMLDLS